MFLLLVLLLIIIIFELIFFTIILINLCFLWYCYYIPLDFFFFFISYFSFLLFFFFSSLLVLTCDTFKARMVVRFCDRTFPLLLHSLLFFPFFLLLLCIPLLYIILFVFTISVFFNTEKRTVYGIVLTPFTDSPVSGPIIRIPGGCYYVLFYWWWYHMWRIFRYYLIIFLSLTVLWVSLFMLLVTEQFIYLCNFQYFFIHLLFCLFISFIHLYTLIIIYQPIRYYLPRHIISYPPI